MDPKPLPYQSLNGISDKTLAIHHDKLYAGYVAKCGEIREKLANLQDADLASANQSYSALRALKTDETFAVNGVYLHEAYFDGMGGEGLAAGTLADALAKEYGSFDRFVAYFSACGMAARGWVVLCWDTQEKALRVYAADAHNQGGVWGCIPLLVLDVYEHAYFIDAGSDRKSYIEAWWKNLDWKKADERYRATQN